MSVFDNYQCEGQMSLFDLDTWCGKMLQEHSVATKERISEPSLKKPQKSQTKTPLFLDLRGGDGLRAVASWETDGVSLGGYMMRSFGEFPNEERESRLSQILEENPPQRFCLSARACQGILDRAERRGKKLPEMLRNALIKQATLSRLGGGREFDSYGKRAGKGALIQTELSATLGVSQDQTLIQTIAIEGNGSRESHHGDGYRVSETMYTLNTTEQHAVCTRGGIYSIGHDIRSAGLTDDEITDPLTATDYKDPIKVAYQTK